MKAVIFTFIACFVAICFAGFRDPNQGFHRVPNGVGASYRNDLRQVAVNQLAKAVGASDGTADYYGVPGAGRYVFDNRYGYGHGYQGDSYHGRPYSGYAAGPYY